MNQYSMEFVWVVSIGQIFAIAAVIFASMAVAYNLKIKMLLVEAHIEVLRKHALETNRRLDIMYITFFENVGLKDQNVIQVPTSESN